MNKKPVAYIAALRDLAKSCGALADWMDGGGEAISFFASQTAVAYWSGRVTEGIKRLDVAWEEDHPKTTTDAYNSLDRSQAVFDYHRRHCTDSACILTVYDDEKASLIAGYLAPRIRGKVVVEIGAGIGLLACHLAAVARRVYAIEVDPTWTSCFVAALYRSKPRNLTFIFGSAEEAPPLAADVALFCTHSGQAAMYRAASRFAPVVIDVYEEILPGAADRARANIERELAAEGRQ